MNQLVADPKFDLDSNITSSDKGGNKVYQIMHKEKTVAEISSRGEAKVLDGIIWIIFIIGALRAFCLWTENMRKQY
ncbi:MAG TPA: hypothetical protein IAA03_10785 [Candidatus Ruminococcus avistercoris]|nr:hypothetical protein [Candidatus Ruminococcus avistercoris]